MHFTVRLHFDRKKPPGVNFVIPTGHSETINKQLLVVILRERWEDCFIHVKCSETGF